MAVFHVGFIQPKSLDSAVTKVIDFAAGRAFGVDKVKSAVARYTNFFQNYQVSLVGLLDEPQGCYESEDEADFGDKEELDILYNLHQDSPGPANHHDNTGPCNVDHIPNTVKYSANLLQNHFMFLTVHNVFKGNGSFCYTNMVS